MPPPQAFVRTGRAARLRTIVAKENAAFGPGFLRSGSAANVTLTTRPYLAVIQRSVFGDEGSADDPLLLALPSKHPTVFGRHPEERFSRRRISLRCQQARPPTVNSAAPAASCAAPPSAFPKKSIHLRSRARSADAYHRPTSNSAPEGRHKLARAVRPGKQKRLSSNFLSRGLLARAFVTSKHNRSREAPPFDCRHTEFET
jgi:hypothetical protein